MPKDNAKKLKAYKDGKKRRAGIYFRDFHRSENYPGEEAAFIPDKGPHVVKGRTLEEVREAVKEAKKYKYPGFTK